MPASSDYERRIKPLLRERCFACHGALKQRAGLRLDTVKLMRVGGNSGAVISDDDPGSSLLVERISSDDPFDRMPPEHEGEPFSEEQIGLIRDWIAAGAPSPQSEQADLDPRDHWAFRPIVRPVVPTATRAGPIRNPIDSFIAQRHEQLGITPQGEAEPLLLLRRLAIDLIGLPPTPSEIAEVQRGDSPDWYDRAAARLLDDPRHGERWARHWMDIWRYSDWWGLGDQLRNSQKHIWHWRDWIIESIDADLPYDEMIRLMLAADELHPNDLDQLRATGFLSRNYFLFNRNQWMDETVEHVSKSFLGLTTNCAKCHDHKYDPISQTDYYRLRAVFEPHHVRLDVRPGEADLDHDGIPRAFDGLPDSPTYLFIRGDENRPDTSASLEPAVPDALRFAPLAIEPVNLPVDSWQPERRPWVVKAYRDAAREKVEAAEARLASARASLARAERDSAGPSSGPEVVSSPNPSTEEVARLELTLAEHVRDAAVAEQRSVELRADAMRVSWNRSDLGDDDPDSDLSQAERAAAIAASRAERAHLATLARVTLAEAELKLVRSVEGERESASKRTEEARTSLDQALKKVEEPGEDYTKLIGARWTPTRFFNSGTDDPTVTFPPQSTGRRKALAEWITDPRNPLTARVAVNHIWARHFGTSLVPTVFDFGRNGQPPIHAELLDWLAAEFIESGWSMKHLHLLIVQSAAYRRSSSLTGAEGNLRIDPDNLQSWRRSPIRIESQAIRDSILALAGTLDSTRGGPPVLPDSQADSTRRSLYFFHSNNQRNLFLTTFDEALVKECYRREQSIVPQQALALTNSQLVLDSLPLIADRLTLALEEEGERDDNRAFIRMAFNVLLGRDSTDDEVEASARALDAWSNLPEAPEGEAARDFARSNLIWVLINHNDFVTLR